jgi:HEAT repeat protein
LISWGLTRTFDFIFASAVDAQFPTEEAYIRFNGLYLIAYSIGSVAFDIWVLPKVIEKIGLVRSMVLTSNVVTVGAMGLLALPILPFVVGAYFLRDIVISLQDNSYQVMFGVIPERYRVRVDAFLSGYLSMIGGGLGSLLVIGVNWLIPAAFELHVALRVFTIVILLLLAGRYFLNFYLRNQFFALLEHNLREGDVRTKLRAVETLVEHKYHRRSGIGLLIDILKDDAEPLAMKENVIAVLGQIGDPTTLRVLFHQLRSPEPSIRLAAARAVATFPRVDKAFYDTAFSRFHAVQELRTLFSHEHDSLIRATALDALIHLQDADVVPFLLELLRSGDEKILEDCLYSLRLFHDPGIIDDARIFLYHPNPRLRELAIVALWQFSWERPMLQEFVDNLFSGARTHAQFQALNADQQRAFQIGIKTLGETHLAKEQTWLEEVVAWPEPAIQLEAALALARLGSLAGAAVIKTALHGGEAAKVEAIRRRATDPTVPRVARQTLAEMLEHTFLAFPSDSVSTEPLNAHIPSIPQASLEQLRELYVAAGEHTELTKIQHFLTRGKQPIATRGKVVVYEPNAALRQMYQIALLAQGYAVTAHDKLSDGPPVVPDSILVVDEKLPGAPALVAAWTKAGLPTLQIANVRQTGSISRAARVIHGEGVVFREHFSPAELVEGVAGRFAHQAKSAAAGV